MTIFTIPSHLILYHVFYGFNQHSYIPFFKQYTVIKFWRYPLNSFSSIFEINISISTL